jgi:hypothetical protein
VQAANASVAEQGRREHLDRRRGRGLPRRGLHGAYVGHYSTIRSPI